MAQLSPPGTAAYYVLAGNQPDQMQSNLDALPPAIPKLLEQLSPSSVVGQICAPIYQLDDRSDPIVPFTEAQLLLKRNFAAALTRPDHPHDLVALSIFQHTEVRSSLDIW